MSPLLQNIEAWAQANQWPVQVSSTTASTNDDARGFTTSESRWLCATDHQTNGRGRGDHRWIDQGASTPGSQLLLSLGFEVQGAPQPVITTRVGHALWQAAEKTWPHLSWGLKPPNDLHLDGHKVAGVLIEAVQSAGSTRWIVGLGLNLTWHPPDIPGTTDLSKHDPAAPQRILSFLELWSEACESCAESCTEVRLREKVRQELQGVLRRRHPCRLRPPTGRR